MRIEETVTKAWAAVLTEKILRDVMSDLQQLGDDSLLAGEGSGLDSVWEEICFQVQTEQSVEWDAYLQTVESFIEMHLDELGREALLALWSVTDSGWSWIYDHHQDEDGDLSAPVDGSEIIQDLSDKLLALADDYTNPNLSRYIDGDDYEDEEDEEDDDGDDEESEYDYPLNTQDQEPKAESVQPVVNYQLTTEEHGQGGTTAAIPDTPSAEEVAALRAEMGQAFSELASLFGGKTNLTEEEEARLLPIMSEIFRIAAEMGYIQGK